MSRTIVLSANSEWNIANFRSGLIQGLRENGYVPVIIAPTDAAVEDRMRSLAVERVALNLDRSGMNPLADLRLFFDYKRLLKHAAPAAYLSYTIKPNIYGAMAASSLGIPAIPNVSGLGTAFIRSGPIQYAVKHLYRLAFKRAPIVFFQNQEDQQLFVAHGIVRAEQGRVLPGSGVDVSRFAPAPPAKGPAAFLFIGRLIADKGVREFVEAARSLRSVLQGAQFQLLGPLDDGNRSTISRAELDSWVKEGIIEYLGTTDDVRPFIERASAIVLPSYREGLPRSLLEAAAMARPLIATDVPGCRDVVDEGVNGYLCAVRDPGSLAFKMRVFAELPAKQQAAMGQAARRKVQERFSEELVIRAYLDVLAAVAPVDSRI